MIDNIFSSLRTQVITQHNHEEIDYFDQQLVSRVVLNRVKSIIFLLISNFD